MSEKLRTVRLYGSLSRFGRVHRLAVASTAEAVRALCVLVPGFERELMTSRDKGIRYACFVGKTNIGQDDLHLAGGGDIRIAPVLAGAKRGGVLQTIIGATLVVIGAAVWGFSAFTDFGASGATIGNFLINAGISMMIGGVIQMLSPQQQSQSAKDSAANGASYNFNGPVNTTAQGNPVPLLYGRLIVGSAVISAGILAQDQAYAGYTLPRAPFNKYTDIYGDEP